FQLIQRTHPSALKSRFDFSAGYSFSSESMASTSRPRRLMSLVSQPPEDEILSDPDTFGGCADFCLIESSSRAPASGIEHISQSLLQDLKVRCSTGEDF